MWLRRFYCFWCLVFFFIPLLLFYPLFFLFNAQKNWKKGIGYLNFIWAKIYFWAAFVPVKIKYHSKISSRKTYIFCANHTSYLDIVTMGYALRGNYAFVGKHSLTKVPFFGLMFKKLHIPVKREIAISAYRAMITMRNTLEEGRSLVIFPEGGIYGEKPPQMTSFKEGAFRLAIETKTPIVPITILYNWYLLADDGRFLPRRHACKAIFHEPISTKNLTLDDINSLRMQVFGIIANELNKHNLEFELMKVKAK
jgi:1-acyl-sn-glycerol-3-phosphate acyltransferase